MAFDKRLPIARRHEHALDAVANEFGDAGEVGRDDRELWLAASIRTFGKPSRSPEARLLGRQHEEVGVAQQRDHVGLRPWRRETRPGRRARSASPAPSGRSEARRRRHGRSASADPAGSAASASSRSSKPFFGDRPPDRDDADGIGRIGAVARRARARAAAGSGRGRGRDRRARPGPGAGASACRCARALAPCRSRPSRRRRSSRASPSPASSRCPWRGPRRSRCGRSGARRSAPRRPACADNGHADGAMSPASSRARTKAWPSRRTRLGVGSRRRSRQNRRSESPEPGLPQAADERRAARAAAPGRDIPAGR